MSGAKALMDEIRRSHYTEPQKSPAAATATPTPTMEKTPEPVRRRKRTRRVTPISDDVSKSGMYTITVVGGMKLPGYPLQDGERLVVAKLTPITVGT